MSVNFFLFLFVCLVDWSFETQLRWAPNLLCVEDDPELLVCLLSLPSAWITGVHYCVWFNVSVCFTLDISAV